MRWITMPILLTCAVSVAAQPPARPAEEAEAALGGLVRRCVEAGGLVQSKDPETGRPALAPGDAARLKDAVAADRSALTRELRDKLIARCGGADAGQRPAYVALLRALGEVAEDDLALAI